MIIKDINEIVNKHRIINSLLDTDLYKFTMAQVVLHHFPGAMTKFKFKCRTDYNLAKYLDEINIELDHLCTLRFLPDELDYLRKIPFFKEDFIDYLEMIKLKRNQINAYINPETKDLEIVAYGPWRDVIWFEVPVLAIVQEVYTRNEYPNIDFEVGRARLMEKIYMAKDYNKHLRYNIADFGTRRRFSREWHREVVKTLSKNLSRGIFTGTSNVLFAKENGIIPIGTMAHEYLQAGQAVGPNLADSQKFMLETWVQEYRGDLGIALSDVVGMDAFLRDFDKYFAKLYDGCRHDSGDPFTWGEKLIQHYNNLKINSLDKIAVFSDGLDFPLSFRLAEYFRGRIQTSFGIGTNITNDLGPEYIPLQNVMKMVMCDGKPVAKISDSKGKGMCEDDEYLKYLKKVFKIED